MEENLNNQEEHAFINEYEGINGGCAYVHSKVDKNASEFNDSWQVARDKANGGCIVHVMPIVNDQLPLYTELFAGAKDRKCPDLKINGQFVAIKSPTEPLTDNKISKCIGNGHSQSNTVIILLATKYPTYRLYSIVKGRFNTHDDLQVIEFKNWERYIVYNRSDFFP